MAVNSFRDVRVWQLGMDLVVQVYALTRGFPRHEVYGLAGQLQRAAVSIPSNIAEGHTRADTKEYLQHVAMAQTSLAEVQTQIEIAFRLNYITEHDSQAVQDRTASLARQLYALRNSLSKDA